MHRLRHAARRPACMCTLAAIFSAAAWAQAVPEPAADLPAVVVTGTRIQRGDDQPAPQSITTVAPDELLNQGDINLGEALNELPALRATFGQANSSRFIGTAGVNWLDLRGLGPAQSHLLQAAQTEADAGEKKVPSNARRTGAARSARRAA